MTIKELRASGITRTRIDNGYRVSPTWQYSKEGVDTVIELDKDDVYGIKCYVASIDGRLVTNFLGKTLYWENQSAAQDDICNMLLGMMPKFAYTMSI